MDRAVKPHIRLHCARAFPPDSSMPFVWCVSWRYPTDAWPRPVTAWVSNPWLAMTLARDQFFRLKSTSHNRQ